MPRGGKREGAGKPALTQEQMRKNMTLRVAPETVGLCKELRAQGYQVGRLVDDLLAAFARHVGILEPDPEIEGGGLDYPE